MRYRCLLRLNSRRRRLQLRQPSIKREQVDSLCSRVFAGGEASVFVGAPGVGETDLATNLPVVRRQQGRGVYFGTLAALTTSLQEAPAAGTLRQRLKTPTPRSLLVSTRSAICRSRARATCSSHLMGAAASHAPILLSIDKDLEEGDEIFDDEVTVVALNRRLLHHCHFAQHRGAPASHALRITTSKASSTATCLPMRTRPPPSAPRGEREEYGGSDGSGSSPSR
jgi:DNA replication protein DnaC